MKIHIDTDVLLDVALQREKHIQMSADVLRWAQRRPGFASVAWHTLSNLAYLIRPDARPFIADLLTFVRVAPVDTEQAKLAAGLPMNDFEDALQAASAMAFGASFIVTRNIKDYRNSPVPALSPANFLSKYSG